MNNSKSLSELDRTLGASLSAPQAITEIRKFGLTDFGKMLWSLPSSDFPNFSKIFPEMASVEIQMNWTGNRDEVLLGQTLDFLRVVAERYVSITGNSLGSSKILDFGCGYGRITRLLEFFTSKENIYGVDPWQESLDICFANGINASFAKSDYLPNSLPFEDVKFDLIFAFSVFTHLSERSAQKSLRAMLDSLAPGGLIVVTIRPVEYWHIDLHANRLGMVREMIEQHEKRGFAFLPHNRDPVDGDITYGDTSFSLDWLEKCMLDARVLGTDYSLNDIHQRYVFIQKK